MFGMNGFHVSASGAIEGHHGPLVFSPQGQGIVREFCEPSGKFENIGKCQGIIRKFFGKKK